MKKILIVTLLILMGGVGFVFGQDDSDFGLWNEVVVTKPLSKQVDLNFGGRFETKSNNSETQEVRGYAGVTFKHGKWSFAPTYAFIRSANRSGRYYNEHRPMITVTRRFIPSKVWNFSLGVRTEFRIRPGKNDWRFVPSLGFERSINKKTKFVNRNEFWMGTRKADPTQYRWRSFFGINRSINKKLSIEPFYMLQIDRKFAPTYGHKVGIYWRIKL